MSDNVATAAPAGDDEHADRTRLPPNVRDLPPGEFFFQEMIHNALTTRQEWIRKYSDPRRDIESECGWPKGPLQPSDYRKMYDGFSIARRVVDVMPAECWQVSPNVYEDEDSENATPFEEAWDAVAEQILGSSWYKTEDSNPIWAELENADKQAGIGHYGVIFLGIDDGEQDLSKPVKGIDEKGESKGSATATRKITFLRVFDESLAPITKWETDRNNPRWGQPTEYRITFNDPAIAGTTSSNGIGVPNDTADVHWSRVIHVNELNTTSSLFHTPRMETPYTHIYDLRKLYGGSAEMYWRGAFPGISLELMPGLNPKDIIVDKAAVRDAMENYMNGLQRYLQMLGLSAKTLAPQVVDPTPQINVQMEAVCILIGCPIRVFKGSERGELASSQDDSSWNDRLRKRQKMHITPRIIVPLINRMIAIGVLPVPKQYFVSWPDLDSLTDAEKATNAQTRTTAMSTYVSGGVEQLMSPMDFLVRVLDFTEEEATEIMNATQEHMAEVQEQQMQQQQDMIDQGLAPDPAFDQHMQQQQLDQKAKPPVDNQVADWLQTTLDLWDTPLINYSPNQMRDYRGRFAKGRGTKPTKPVDKARGVNDPTKVFKWNTPTAGKGRIIQEHKEVSTPGGGKTTEYKTTIYSNGKKVATVRGLGNEAAHATKVFQHVQSHYGVNVGPAFPRHTFDVTGVATPKAGHGPTPPTPPAVPKPHTPTPPKPTPPVGGLGNLGTHHGLMEHLGTLKLSTHMTKLKAINPQGIADGKILVPKAMTPAQIEILRKSLPAGIEIKAVNALAIMKKLNAPTPPKAIPKTKTPGKPKPETPKSPGSKTPVAYHKNFTHDEAIKFVQSHGVKVIGRPTSIDTSRDAAAAVHAFVKRGLGEKLNGVTMVMGSGATRSMLGTTLRGAYGMYSGMDHPNKIFLSDKIKRSELERNEATGWLSVGSAGGTAVHELGHLFHHQKAGSSTYFYNRTLSPSAKIIAGRVSRYAMTNIPEFIAETFSGKMHGKKYDEDVERLYKLYHGPDVKGPR